MGKAPKKKKNKGTTRKISDQNKNKKTPRSPAIKTPWNSIGFGFVYGLAFFLVSQLLAVYVVYPASESAYATFCWFFVIAPLIGWIYLARTRPFKELIQNRGWENSYIYTLWPHLLSSSSFIYAYHVGISILGVFQPLVVGLVVLVIAVLFFTFRQRCSFYLTSLVASYLIVSTFVLFFMLVEPQRVIILPSEF